MSFDPFGDFETHGYLRNIAGQKDPEIVKRLEHNSFLTGIETAFRNLAARETLTYCDVLETHKTLFEAVYPWAGQDRSQTAPEIAVSKGPVLFAHPNDARIAVEHALQIGQDVQLMAAKPGEVMGYLAYGHPFLDGNGRTIMTVHAELAHRAGIGIDWAATDKIDYLTALTRELDHPNKGHLDAYLKPFVGQTVGRDQLAGHISRTPGLDGRAGQVKAPNEVLGRFDDPVLQERYKAQQQQREQSAGGAEQEITRDMGRDGPTRGGRSRR